LESRKHERHDSTKKEENVGHEFEELSKKVIAAALAVHRHLGPGFLESTYQAAMQVSLAHRSVPFHSQVPVEICFEGVEVGQSRLDLIVR
jgi:GxxExxY protein